MENYDEQRYQAALKKAENFIELALNAKGGVCIKRIVMASLLFGEMNMTVSLGGGEHNSYIVIDGIYDYARKHPESNLPDFLDGTMYDDETIYHVQQSQFLINSIYSIKGIARMFDCYEYILKCQREKTATFYLDVGKYLELTKTELTNVYTSPEKWAIKPRQEEYYKYRARLEENKTWIEERFHYIEELLRNPDAAIEINVFDTPQNSAADANQSSEEKKKKSWKDIIVEDIRSLLKKLKD